ncbi:unnamed protein product, partial [Didymodactylos carnosus]
LDLLPLTTFLTRSRILEITTCICLAILTTTYYRRDKKKKIDKLESSSDNTTTRKKLDDYSYRDLFHFFINPEDHFDKYDLAKEFSERMHAEAAVYMMRDHDDDPDFPDHFTYIPYEREAVDKRLEYIFNRLWKGRYLDWLEAGMPVDSNSQYWWAQTKLHLATWLMQREPFHLTDGVWLRGNAPTGPCTLIDAKLFAIYIDELGNGDVEQNHCNVYLNVLSALGLSVPDIHTREFVDQKSIMDISFKKPLLTLTTSLFPKAFYPEILGYTLWLETTSATEHSPLRKLLERHGLSPKFSLLHTAIDNNANGHGRYAIEAIYLYLEEIGTKYGDNEVQIQWKRIWTGYTAYGMIGNIDDELRKLFDIQKRTTPRDEFINLIKKKAPMAQKMHGKRKIDGCYLNELFMGDPKILCEKLENSNMIVKGDPKSSFLLNHAVSFHGPMYQVFDTDELTIISRWILSLEPSAVNDMYSLILKKRRHAQNAHINIKLKLPDGNEKTIHELLSKPDQLMAALRASDYCHPENGLPLKEENLHTCKLMVLVSDGGAMSHIFTSYELDIIRRWLLQGAPLPPEVDDIVKIQSHDTFQYEL